MENKEWNFNWEPSHTENARHSRTINYPTLSEVNMVERGEGERGGRERERERAREREREKERKGEREREKERKGERGTETEAIPSYRGLFCLLPKSFLPACPCTPTDRDRAAIERRLKGGHCSFGDRHGGQGLRCLFPPLEL